MAIFPNGAERHQVARITNAPGGTDKITPLQVLPGIAGVDSDELHHTRVSITIDHAPRAAIAN